MLRKSLSIVIFVVLAAGTLHAEPQRRGSRDADSLRPRTVGVVMSGGGAKGLYHIGVLEALEENGIPIDYIAGTSMGSITAAMYAAGYSPAEMRMIAASGAVKEWLAGRIDPRYTPYYRQVGRVPGFVNLRLDMNSPAGKTLHMPTSLVSSIQVDMALTEMFAPATAAAEGNFDDLMVPFLCVSSDIKAREPVIMRNGDLGEAVRSSMSIPLVFKPVKKDAMLLYDGGIYDNFPWRPLDTGFRPDLIVGSICTAGNTLPDETNSIFDQAFVLAMHETDYNLPKGRSVTIRRAVDVSMLDFDNAVAIMDAGYADAMAAMPQLLERVSEQWTPERYSERRAAFRAKCPPLIFNNYKIDGLDEAPEMYIREFLHVDRRTPGVQRRMGFDELRDNLYAVLADGDFEMDFPHVAYDSVKKRYSFEAAFRTKPNFRITVGGNISSTAFNQAYLGVNYQKIGRARQEASAEIYLGPIYMWGSVGGRTDFYFGKPIFLDYSANFSISNFRHGNFGNLTEIDDTQDVRFGEGFFTFAAGIPLTHRSVLQMRLNGGAVNYRYDTEEAGMTGTDLTRFAYFGAKAVMERNTFDKVLWPRRGSNLRLSAIYIAGRDKYEPDGTEQFVSRTTRQWFGGRFTWDKYFDSSSGGRLSLGLNIDAVVTNIPDFTTGSATLMAMPSYAPTPHAHMVYIPDFRGRRFVAGGVKPTVDLLPNFFLRAGFYAMYREKHDYTPADLGNRIDERLHYITELSLVYHTPIGPLSLAVTKYDLNSWRNMYLSFNFGYAIFAPKGTFY